VGERNSRREADPSAAVGMTDDGEGKLETRRQKLELQTRNLKLEIRRGKGEIRN